jgi:transcriptional regulator with XRE-family HTH domain
MNERLKQLRVALGLSQEEFGKRIHVQKGHVSSMESGARNITSRTIIDVCREFNVNEEWLRTGSGDMFNTEDDLLEVLTAELKNLDELDKKFIMNYMKLAPKHRSIFKDFLMKLAE